MLSYFLINKEKSFEKKRITELRNTFCFYSFFQILSKLVQREKKENYPKQERDSPEGFRFDRRRLFFFYPPHPPEFRLANPSGENVESVRGKSRTRASLCFHVEVRVKTAGGFDHSTLSVFALRAFQR